MSCRSISLTSSSVLPSTASMSMEAAAQADDAALALKAHLLQAALRVEAGLDADLVAAQGVEAAKFQLGLGQRAAVVGVLVMVQDVLWYMLKLIAAAASWPRRGLRRAR